MQENNGNTGIRNYFFYKPNDEIVRFKNSTEVIVNFIESLNSNDVRVNEINHIFSSYLVALDRVIEERKMVDMPFDS